jgi:hypothetical protein
MLWNAETLFLFIFLSNPTEERGFAMDMPFVTFKREVAIMILLSTTDY